MTVPNWLAAVIDDFGRAAGLARLALNERGAAALKFENGATFRLEYSGGELLAAMSLPPPAESARLDVVKRMLSLSNPGSRFGFKLRTGTMPRRGEPVLAIRLAEREVTHPRLNAAFSVLWRLASEIGGSSWV